MSYCACFEHGCYKQSDQSLHRGGSSQASEFASQVTVECNSYHIKVVP